MGGDERIVAAHDRAVGKTLAWIEPNAIETRTQDRATGAMVRAGNQKMVAATFRHDISRNLDPQLHTHAVIANMAQGGDGKWRTMVDDGLYSGKMAIGAIYRAELAEGLRAGIRDREDAPGREVRDKGGVAGGYRGVLDAARGDRGRDGTAGPGEVGRESAPCGPGGAHDAGAQARGGQG